MQRLKIEYRLSANSGVLIGSTADVLSIGLDKSTIRRRKFTGRARTGRADQELLIPGSTLKGKLRNECERILASRDHPVCQAPTAETMCPHLPSLKGETCPICKLFGGPSRKSRLFFSDATACDASLASYMTRVQAGVSISRRRGTAEDERLYFIERGVEGIVYEGQIDGYLDDGKASAELALMTCALERLVAIGGGKSRGTGWLSVEIVKITLDGRELSAEELAALQEEGLRAWHGSK